MKSNFAACLPEILRHEGGWADHPKDPGGATMKGITIGTYAQWKGRKVTKAELRAITDAEVAAIYKRNYWDKVRGDDLPAGLDLVAFDAAVNSGPSRGAKWLQQGLGVAADGKVGPMTIEAAKTFDRTGDADDAINGALDARLAFLRGLKTWPTFGKGWGRRVAEVRAKALAMADAPIMTKMQPKPQQNKAGKPDIMTSPAKETAKSAAGGLLGGGVALGVVALWDQIKAALGKLAAFYDALTPWN
jgi:lysozyme family protein